MTNLTELETKVLRNWYTNYDDSPETEKQDNCTPMQARDIAAENKISVNSAKGVAGSLIKKGLIEIVEGDGFDTPDNFWLTNEGIDAVFEARKGA